MFHFNGSLIFIELNSRCFKKIFRENFKLLLRRIESCLEDNEYEKCWYNSLKSLLTKSGISETVDLHVQKILAVEVFVVFYFYFLSFKIEFFHFYNWNVEQLLLNILLMIWFFVVALCRFWSSKTKKYTALSNYCTKHTSYSENGLPFTLVLPFLM